MIDLKDFEKELITRLNNLSDEELIARLEIYSDTIRSSIKPIKPVSELLFEEMTTCHQDDVAEAITKWVASPHCGVRSIQKIKDWCEGHKSVSEFLNVKDQITVHGIYKCASYYAGVCLVLKD